MAHKRRGRISKSSKILNNFFLSSTVMQYKFMLFVVISFLVVALIYSSFSTFEVNARNMTPYSCGPRSGGTIGTVECCAVDLDTSATWCTTCDATNPPSNCSEAELQFKEQPPTPPLTPRGAPTLGEIAPEVEQPPTPPQPTPRTQGQSVLPGEGVLQQPPVDEETQPQDVEKEPLCLEGQVLDEETGLCVLEEPEVAEEEPG